MKRIFSPDWITDNLAVGPTPLGPEDYELLQRMKVSFILTLQEEQELARTGRKADVEFSVAGGFGITVYRVPIREFDGKALLKAMDEAVDTLTQLLGTGSKVYLHCAEGLKRSPTVAAAYLVAATGVSPEEAVDQVTAAHNSMPDLAVISLWSTERGWQHE